MRVKLHNNGYTKIYDVGDNISVNGDYTKDKEVQEWITNGGAVEPFETQAEIDARVIAEANQVIYQELEDLDRQSIRALREYIASLPDAPQILKDREAAATIVRRKIR